jgi:dihydrolipoamide dehydrogenase
MLIQGQSHQVPVNSMKEYGLIVIGSGAGMNVIDNALAQGMKVALIEEGPIGGTCLNRGCIPSKVLIHAADVIRESEEAAKIGVHLKLERMDYPALKKRMWDLVLPDRHGMEEAIKRTHGLDLYPVIGEFTSDYTMKVGSETITAPRIVIASGARALVPPIPGLDKIKYYTYRTVFDIEEQPDSMVILGGGYIGCELAHFFSATGAKVTLIGRNPVLLPHEEPETSLLVKKRLSKHVDVHTGHQPRRGPERASRGDVQGSVRGSGEDCRGSTSSGGRWSAIELRLAEARQDRRQHR